LNGFKTVPDPLFHAGDFFTIKSVIFLIYD